MTKHGHQANWERPLGGEAKEMEHRYIAVEGPMGAGKSGLAGQLCLRLGARRISDAAAATNPFLKSFFKQREKYAFQTQVYFLLERYRQQQELLQQELFQSVTVSSYLFGKESIHASLTLSEDERSLYGRVYDTLKARVAQPDLVIYLQARPQVLLQRIRRRGRDFERRVEGAYVESLCQAYNDFFFHYSETPLLIVNSSEADLSSAETIESLLSVMARMGEGTYHYAPLAKGS
jgi:deoxyadenosine/deoxycytidine kinase